MRTTPEFWLVEDSDEDAEIFLYAAESTALPASVRRFGSAEDCANAFRNGERPQLLVLDLNLPGLDGGGLLRHLKAEPSLRTIPVLILSSSGTQKDRHEAYDLGAAAYLAKPLGIARYEELLRSIGDFWLGHVRL